MADIKSFKAIEYSKLLDFYFRFSNFALIEALIRATPLAELNEILESDYNTINKFTGKSNDNT